MKLRDFSFLDPGRLAAMNLPGLYSPIEKDLEFLKSKRITHILTLTPYPLDVPDGYRNTFTYLHFPIEDMSIPDDINLTRQTILRVISDIKEKQAVYLFHCYAGYGRTGLMAALYFIEMYGFKPYKAIMTVRALRPSSIETYQQEQFVYDYYETFVKPHT